MKTKINFYYSNTHEAGFSVHFHTHSYYEIIHYIDAHGYTVIGGTEYSIKPNSIAVIEPEVSHNEVHHTSGKLAYIGLETDYPLETNMYYSPENSGTVKVFKLIISELLNRPNDYELMAHSLATQLAILLKRLDNENAASDKSNIKFSIEFIKENYFGKINFNELAQLNGYSENYFRRIFKKSTGMSPQRFLTTTRLSNVKNFLENSNFNITEIAYRCGFSNSAQLSTMFKSEYGITPNEYRKSIVSQI